MLKQISYSDEETAAAIVTLLLVKKKKNKKKSQRSVWVKRWEGELISASLRRWSTNFEDAGPRIKI